MAGKEEDKGEALENEGELFKERMDMGKFLYTVKEVSELLNIKVSRVRQAVFRREIDYIKIGALVRFREVDIDNFIRQNVICRVQS